MEKRGTMFGKWSIVTLLITGLAPENNYARIRTPWYLRLPEEEHTLL
jgi:hypothetical protein